MTFQSLQYGAKDTIMLQIKGYNVGTYEFIKYFLKGASIRVPKVEAQSSRKMGMQRWKP